MVKFLIPFILSAVLTLIALIYFPIPFLWVFLSWFICFILCFYVTQKYIYKAVWFNLAFIFLVFGVVEVFSWSSLRKEEKESRFDIKYTGGHNAYDDILGYAPKKSNTIVSKKYKGDQLLYDVTYTIGDDGLRITPKYELSDVNQCVIFFGGSFTFGEGVNDDETMPYFVGKKSKYNTYNFAFYGYGPHQMLSALEHGIVDKIVECEPTIVIYQAPSSHVQRSAGLSEWDKHGPKYILLSDGSVKYDGHFDDHASTAMRDEGSPFTTLINTQINKLFIFKKYIENILPYSDEDINLFLAIVDASRIEIAGKYPGTAFHVIFWDYNPNHRNFKKILEGLKGKGIKLHLISEILPDFNHQQSRYEISPDETHPNALAHETIAQYVVDEILNKVQVESQRSKVESLSIE